jgi:hypothetical protein
MMGSSVTATTPEVGAMFICMEQAAKGTFTIPAAILASMPASTTTDGMPTGMLMVGNMPKFDDGHKFTATGLDAGYIYYSTLNAKNVNYK